jgi:hypothetical protein
MNLELLVRYTSLARDEIYNNKARKNHCQQEELQAVFTLPLNTSSSKPGKV